MTQMIKVKFCGSEITGELLEKNETHTTIRVLEHKKGDFKRHKIGVWKSDRYSQVSVLNENVISELGKE